MGAKVLRQYEGNKSRYWARMIAAGWLDCEVAKPPRKKERCVACERGPASLWCAWSKSFFYAQSMQGFDCKDKKVIWCPECMVEWDMETQS